MICVQDPICRLRAAGLRGIDTRETWCANERVPTNGLCAVPQARPHTHGYNCACVAIDRLNRAVLSGECSDVPRLVSIEVSARKSGRTLSCTAARNYASAQLTISFRPSKPAPAGNSAGPAEGWLLMPGWWYRRLVWLWCLAVEAEMCARRDQMPRGCKCKGCRCGGRVLRRSGRRAGVLGEDGYDGYSLKRSTLGTALPTANIELHCVPVLLHLHVP
jgi:hypothetical protein